jgi:hypothetical protein
VFLPNEAVRARFSILSRRLELANEIRNWPGRRLSGLDDGQLGGGLTEAGKRESSVATHFVTISATTWCSRVPMAEGTEAIRASAVDAHRYLVAPACWCTPESWDEALRPY